MTPDEFCSYSRQLFLAGMLLITDIQKDPKAMETLQRLLKQESPLHVILDLLSVIDSEQL